jgi:putative transposase
MIIFHSVTACRLINTVRLQKLLHISSHDELKNLHNKWVEETIRNKRQIRDEKWTQSVTVGSQNFIELTHKRLDARVIGRKIIQSDDKSFQIREDVSVYNVNFDHKTATLNANNDYY